MIENWFVGLRLAPSVYPLSQIARDAHCQQLIGPLALT
jgi:hypothetical protein